MIKHTFILALLLSTSFVFGQTLSGILPPNFKEKVPNTTKFYTAEKVNNELERQNAQLSIEESHDKMMRFGKELATNIDFISAADQFVQPNGRTLFQYGIKANGALSINLILEKFHLADDAHLFLTDLKTKKFIGAYTSANNNIAEVLGTELLNSDEIVIVLDEPANVSAPSRFTISTVVHGFEDLEILAKGLNTSGDCHYDVNCSIGTGYELQRNSVAMMVSGGGFCTGSLVNNTSGNIIPYFISARHCGITPANWVFRFRWEAPAGQTSCATTSPSGNGPQTYNVNGAELKAQNGSSDFVLVKLNSNPDPNWGIYYNGWDNTDSITATMGIGIHHPDGDIKKISIDNDPLAQQTIFFNGTQNNSWLINGWDFGTTEPGSSGSPLFNHEKRLIGVLSGGTAACQGTSPNTSPDFYGRFGYAWNNSLNSSGRLIDWLDSANTGATIIDGVDPLVGYDLVDASLSTILGVPESRCDSVATINFQLINSGLNNLTQVDFAYGFNGAFNNNYTWTGNLPTYGSASINLVNIVIPFGQNDFAIKVVNSNGSLDPNVSNNFVYTSMHRLQNDFTAKLALDLDCYGTETSWKLKDNVGNVLYSSEPYSDNANGLYEYLFCLEFGCYTMTIYDQYGDGMSGCSAGDGGNGSYVLSDNATGIVITELLENDANFGNSLDNAFCFYSSTSLNEYNLKNLISMFPNPGNELINIQTGNVELNEITVFSYTGQEVFNGEFSGNNATVNTQNWPASVYLVKIKTDKGELMKRWVKK